VTNRKRCPEKGSVLKSRQWNRVKEIKPGESSASKGVCSTAGMAKKLNLQVGIKRENGVGIRNIFKTDRKKG